MQTPKTVIASLLRVPAVIELTGYSRASLYRKMDEGSFPKPLRIGARAVAWRQSDLQQWMDDCETADPSNLH